MVSARAGIDRYDLCAVGSRGGGGVRSGRPASLRQGARGRVGMGCERAAGQRHRGATHEVPKPHRQPPTDIPQPLTASTVHPRRRCSATCPTPTSCRCTTCPTSGGCRCSWPSRCGAQAGSGCECVWWARGTVGLEETLERAATRPLHVMEQIQGWGALSGTVWPPLQVKCAGEWRGLVTVCT